ncbi:DUF1642 domain-containing protein [Streptococcus suis]|uniref:DUF1642 domain-containing protein n=1 Tax=Streptococcus suis TaxID=1307 RepID=UPI000F63133A|nr:DUF1642 domain-containing protein [Streptococcus suis]RRR51810.1 DUF1642 domain-containing protein [Streptococcus suis]
MNKQEAIEQLEWNVVRTTDFDRAEDVVVFEKAKEIISQIHKPQTVVVPKFIADSIEYCKNKEGYGLLRAMDYCDEYNDTGEWLEHNQETFALAWLFGYEIEQEQLYTVEIPNPNAKYSRIVLQRLRENALQLKEYTVDDWKTYKMNQLTEAEIKEDFEWAWQFAKEVE